MADARPGSTAYALAKPNASPAKGSVTANALVGVGNKEDMTLGSLVRRLVRTDHAFVTGEMKMVKDERTDFNPIQSRFTEHVQADFFRCPARR